VENRSECLVDYFLTPLTFNLCSAALTYGTSSDVITDAKLIFAPGYVVFLF
jgi:hypothetical protein